MAGAGARNRPACVRHAKQLEVRLVACLSPLPVAQGGRASAQSGDVWHCCAANSPPVIFLRRAKGLVLLAATAVGAGVETTACMQALSWCFQAIFLLENTGVHLTMDPRLTEVP